MKSILFTCIAAATLLSTASAAPKSSSPIAQPKIVGGELATKGEFPWMSALVVTGINPMECESLNEQRLNEKQLMKSLLRKHSEYGQQRGGSDFLCAVCEDGSDVLDLIVCDNIQCN